MKILFTWILKIAPMNGGVERVTSIVMNGLQSRGFHCNNIICENNNDFYINNVVSDNSHLSVDQLKIYLKEQQYDVIICQDGYNKSLIKTFKEIAPKKTKIVVCLHNSPTMWEEVFSVENVKREIRKAVEINLKLFWLARLLIQPIWKRYALKGIVKIYKLNYQYCDKYILLSERFFPEMKKYLRLNDYNKLYAIPNPLSFDMIESPDILKKKKSTYGDSIG